VVDFSIITNSLVHGYASLKISPESLACILRCRCKDYNFQKRNFACCFVRVRNMVTNFKGRTRAEGVYEWGAGDDIGPTREEMTGDWKSWHGEELHDLCCLQDFRAITSGTTRYAKREICTGDWKNSHRVLLRKRKGRRTTWKAWL